MNCNYCGKKIPDGYEKKQCPHCFVDLTWELPLKKAKKQEFDEVDEKKWREK